MTNRKSYTGFPTSYSWNVYVYLQVSQRVTQKANFSFFGIKVNFNSMKSATKFLWEKTSSGNIVVPTHSPI